MGRRQKRRLKTVYFNPDREKGLMDYANGLGNFSEWAKAHIRREMQVLETGIDPAVEELVERLLEIKLASRVVITQAGSEKGEEDKKIICDLDAFF